LSDIVCTVKEKDRRLQRTFGAGSRIVTGGGPLRDAMKLAGEVRHGRQIRQPRVEDESDEAAAVYYDKSCDHSPTFGNNQLKDSAARDRIIRSGFQSNGCFWT